MDDTRYVDTGRWARLSVGKKAGRGFHIDKRIRDVRLTHPLGVVRRAQCRLCGACDRRPRCKPVTRTPDHQIVADTPGLEPAGNVSQVAVDLETRGQRREAVGEVALIISIVVDKLVDRRIDVSIGDLVQAPKYDVPVRVEVVLYTYFGDLRGKVHARERLPVALARRIRRLFRQQNILGRRRGRRVSKPAGVSVLIQIVVTVVPFDHGMFRRTNIDRNRGQLTPKLAVGDIAIAVGQQEIRTITENLVFAYASTEVGMSGSDGSALITQLDFTVRFLGGALGNKVEHARRIGWTIQWAAQSVDRKS